jgi:protein-S-isoprenylcysteine O-methyltransferase Ste14
LNAKPEGARRAALLIVRLLAEERLLAERLPGYLAYMNTARSRLIPGVW